SRASGLEIPIERVAPGEPIPGLPEPVVALAAALETYDSPIPMERTAAEFGVERTGVDECAQMRLNPELQAWGARLQTPRSPDERPLRDGGSVLLVDDAALHHEADILQQRNVLERIAAYGHDVGMVSGLYRAQLVGHAERFRGVARRGEERGRGRHAGLDHELELSCVPPVLEDA